MSSSKLDHPNSSAAADCFPGRSAHRNTVAGVARKFILGAGISLLLATASQATLQVTYEMEALATGTLGATSSNVTINSPTNVSITTPGQSATVVMGLFAIFNNTFTNNTYETTAGNIISSLTSGALAGAFSSSSGGTNNQLSNFGGSGTGSGALLASATGTDLSGLGAPTAGYFANGTADLIGDIGDTPAHTTAGASANEFKAVATTNGGVTVPLVNGVPTIEIGEFVLSLSSTASGGTTIGYYPTIVVSGGAVGKEINTWKIGSSSSTQTAWAENYNGSLGTSADQSSMSFVPLSILVPVPEPSSFAMVLMGSVSMLGMRRLIVRRKYS